MAIKTPPKLLTYEEYMAEGEVKEGYDIIDGERTFMPGPRWRHQRIDLALPLADFVAA